MATVQELEQGLNKYFRPLTFPLAIKMLESEDEIPDRTRRPMEHLGKKVAICQGIGMARKYGWAIAMGKEDMQCSLGAAPFGFFKDIDFYNEGNLSAGMFTPSTEVGKTQEDLVDRFGYGEYKYILVAPLQFTTFEPDLYMVYGNPAQIMRLWRPHLRYDPGLRDGILHPAIKSRHIAGWAAQDPQGRRALPDHQLLRLRRHLPTLIS